MSIDDQNDAQLRARAYFVRRGVDPVRHGGAGLRTFLNIAEMWDLSLGEQMALLGIRDPAIFADWKVRVRAHEAIAIPVDVIVRIGCVLSIYASLRALFPEGQAVGWLHTPNADRLFGGRTVLAVMINGELDDLDAVVGYLRRRIYG